MLLRGVSCHQAALAQSVERKALNLVVAGSSPAGGNLFIRLTTVVMCARCLCW